jgi:hypothetical protein
VQTRAEGQLAQYHVVHLATHGTLARDKEWIRIAERVR